MDISWFIYFIFLKQLKDLNDQQIIEEAEYEAMKQGALRMAEEKAFKKSEEKPLPDKETEENSNSQK